jgi:heme-degrading monooxygenase HmoA
MIVVLFELRANPGREPDYFNLAAALRQELERIDGFISVERFESLSEKGKFLSVSLWRDQSAVEAWRNQADHRRAQARGQGEIFAEYRLRVAEVTREYHFQQGRREVIAH